MANSFVPSLIALLVVLVLVVVTLQLLRRIQGQGGVRRSGPLAIHATLPLGPRERVMLVEAAGRWLLIGVTASTVSTLAEYDQAPEIGAAEHGRGFADALSRFRKAGDANP